MNFKKFVLEPHHWTPHSLFFSLKARPLSVLLESTRFHPITSRYSFLGLQPKEIFEATGSLCRLSENNQTRTWEGNPLTFLKQKINQWETSELGLDLPPFVGGGIGFLGYESLQWTEPIRFCKKPDNPIPDVYFLFFDWVIVFDHLKNNILVVGKESATHEMEHFIDEWTHLKEKTFPVEQPANSDDPSRWESNFSKSTFCQAVDRIKEYIAQGDIFQANLSQRLKAQTAATGEELYLALNQINPSPFSSYLRTPEFEIISCSPERLCRNFDSVAETRPIAGTRPRAINPSEDHLLEQELQINTKERAEHVMLLDLERNDLGKVCEYGTVEVNEFLGVENYSHVRHLVSNVQGRLKEKGDSVDLLKALFPGGTITGTPKVRSMEIIDELENVKRGPYTGSLGYFSYTGNADFNILIRTFIKKENSLYLHVGAGIVADSLPEKEYEETWHKAKALTQALSLAESRIKHGSYCLS